MSPTELTKVRDVLARALSVEAVNQLGRDTGQAVRLRTVTPHRLFLAVVSALASGHVASLADLLRAFNYHNGVHVAYKAFYNRLARVGFTLFMRGMCARLIERLRLQTLTPAGHTAVARFTDIVIHDGSSFAVKPTLRGTFPGRFTTLGPAAVRSTPPIAGVPTRSAPCRSRRTGRRNARSCRIPRRSRGACCWLTAATRGVPYFEAVQAHGGAFLVRLTRNYDPWVRTAWVDGRRSTVPPGIRLSRFLATRATRTVDLDVEFDRGDHRVGFRVVAVPGRDPTMTRLCTNLPRTPFSPALVARLYRFRWQIELCFKEWKSYANLHKFDTANPHIAEGLIWASLCAAILKRFLAHAAQYVGRGAAVSTRRVAMCAWHILEALVRALLQGVGLRGALRRGLAYLLANARRANVPREHRTGRLRAGLELVVPA